MFLESLQKIHVKNITLNTSFFWDKRLEQCDFYERSNIHSFWRWLRSKLPPRKDAEGRFWDSLICSNIDGKPFFMLIFLHTTFSFLLHDCGERIQSMKFIQSYSISKNIITFWSWVILIRLKDCVNKDI